MQDDEALLVKGLCLGIVAQWCCQPSQSYQDATEGLSVVDLASQGECFLIGGSRQRVILPVIGGPAKPGEQIYDQFVMFQLARDSQSFLGIDLRLLRLASHDGQ